jgi:hypothetical protein
MKSEDQKYKIVHEHVNTCVINAMLKSRTSSNPRSQAKMDTSGIEPDTSPRFESQMLRERDNQLHHVPAERLLL